MIHGTKHLRLPNDLRLNACAALVSHCLHGAGRLVVKVLAAPNFSKGTLTKRPQSFKVPIEVASAELLRLWARSFCEVQRDKACTKCHLLFHL